MSYIVYNIDKYHSYTYIRDKNNIIQRFNKSCGTQQENLE